MRAFLTFGPEDVEELFCFFSPRFLTAGLSKAFSPNFMISGARTNPPSVGAFEAPPAGPRAGRTGSPAQQECVCDHALLTPLEFPSAETSEPVHGRLLTSQEYFKLYKPHSQQVKPTLF